MSLHSPARKRRPTARRRPPSPPSASLPETPPSNRRRRLGLIALAALVLVVSMVAVRELTVDDRGVTAAPGTEVEMFAGIPQSGWTLGDPDAPVTVVEFVDMQCQFCAQFSRNDFVDILERYVRTGRVKFEMRTLAFIGPDSVRAGEAVAAAAAENKAWDFAHAFFESQGVENTGYVNDDFLRGLAAAVPGLDGGVVTRRGDTSGMELAERQAQRARVESTPSFLVNDELVTLDGLEEAIEAAL